MSMGRVGRWLIMLAVSLAVIVIISLLLLRTALHNQFAVDFAVEQLQAILPELTINEATGTFADGLTIQQIRWLDDSVDMRLKEVAVLPKINCLLQLQVCAESLSIELLSIKLFGETESANQVNDAVSLPILATPLPLSIKQLNISQFEILKEDDTTIFKLENSKAKVNWLLTTVRVDELTTRYYYQDEPYDLWLDGRIKLRSGYPIQADARLNTPLAIGNIDLDVHGDLNNLQSEGKALGPWPILYKLSLTPLQSPLAWQVEFGLDRYEYSDADIGEITLTNILVTATGKDLQLSSNIKSQFETSQWQGINQLESRLKLNASTLKVDQLAIILPQGKITGQGKVHLGDNFQGPYRASFTSQTQHINPALFYPKMSGDLDSRMAIDALLTQDQETLLAQTVEVTLESLSGTLEGENIEGRGKFAWDSNTGLTVKQAEISHEENLVALRRQWREGESISLSLDIKSLNLYANWLDTALAGEAKGEVDLLPTSKQSLPITKGAVIFREFQYDELSVSYADIKVEAYRKDAHKIELATKALSYQTQHLKQLQGKITGNLASVRIESQAESEEYGNVTLDCRMNQLQKLLEETTAVNCSKAYWQPLESWRQANWQNTVPIELSLDLVGNEFHLQPFCMKEDKSAGGASVCTEQTTSWRKGNADILAEARQFNWETLNPWLNEGWRLHGTINGDISAQITDSDLAHFTADLNSYDSHLEWQRKKENLTIPFKQLKLTLQGTLDSAIVYTTIDALDYGNINGQLMIDGQRTIDGNLAINQFQLTTLEFLLPDVREVGGVANANLVLTGTIEKPSVEGQLLIKDGGMIHPDLPKQINKANIEATFDQFQTIYQGNLLLGDAKTSINGQVDWRETPIFAVLELDSNDMELSPLPQTDLWLNSDIKLQWRQNTLTIDGNVEIPQAFINIKSLPKNSVGVSSDVVIVDGEYQNQQQVPTYAQVNVQLGNDVLFRGFGLETHLRGKIRLDYSPQQLLQGNGFVQLVDGRYKAYGQNLKIRSGELIFVGPLDNPTIYVDAIRDDITDAVTVGIRAEGQARNPNVTLFSQPAMSDQAKLHYLITGQAPGQGTSDSNAMLSQAAIGLGAATGETALQDYADKLGIRNFQISAGEGSNGTELQLSGYLNPKLYVSYGMGVFEKVNSLTMRYKLRSNLFLEAVSSTANTLDLLWKFQVGKREGKEKAPAEIQSRK